MLAGDLLSRAMKNLLYSVQTRITGFEQAFGIRFFNRLARPPEKASVFSETLVRSRKT
jgi:hypothetical protein